MTRQEEVFMKTIMLVDDEENFVESLVEGFKNYQDKFRVVTASNGKEAIEKLEKSEKGIDLLITDIRMPVLDGFGLLAHVFNKYPDLPVVVMTAYGTPELEKKLRGFGEITYLEKPIDFENLVEIIQFELEQSARGYLHGITLAGFLQIVEIERKSGALLVVSEEKQGYIYFSRGNVINAKTGELEGEQAFYEILSWDDVEIEVQKLPRNIPVKIKRSLTGLVMEAMKVKDESKLQDESSAADVLFSSFSDLEGLKSMFVFDLQNYEVLKSSPNSEKFQKIRSFLIKMFQLIASSFGQEEVDYLLFDDNKEMSFLVFEFKEIGCGLVVERGYLGRVIYKIHDLKDNAS